ncbi:MAG: VRR-NUC domain-containing protein [Treponema sp.]|nr:VRR-NUC domain-containing protein [Treponema sp.]
MTKESAVLKACLEYLRIRHHLVARINNGAFETKRGGFVRCTDVPGWPDISGVTFDGKALAVEVKSEKGKLSRSQEIFKAAWIARGGVYVLARGIGDLQAEGL